MTVGTALLIVIILFFFFVFMYSFPALFLLMIVQRIEDAIQKAKKSIMGGTKNE